VLADTEPSGHANCHGNAERDSDAVVDGDSDGDGDSQPNRNGHVRAHAVCDAEPGWHGNGVAEPRNDAQWNVDSDSKWYDVELGHANRDGDANCHVRSDADGDCEPVSIGDHHGPANPDVVGEPIALGIFNGLSAAGHL